jgi:asparaginyl-tRNA synthetase
MSTVHVDDKAGSDATGSGSPESPYQSLAFAILTRGADAKFLTRSDPDKNYEEVTPSALKKGKKSAQILEGKKKKEEERASRDQKEAEEAKERLEKKLQESKAIKLTEDSSLPPAKKVRS